MPLQSLTLDCMSCFAIGFPLLGTTEYPQAPFTVAKISPYCKVKFSDAATGSEVKKTSEKQGRGRKLMHPETRPFAQEVATAKPLGRGQTLFVKTSGLSVAEKASLA
jgi:hypothetical protein